MSESERGSDKKEDSMEERAGKRARKTVGGDGGGEEKEGVATADGNDDAYESPEAWAAWEEEMKQYAGWEKGEGARAGPMTVHQPCVDASDPSAFILDELTSQLLEDMETRVSILSTMVEAGVNPNTVRQVYASHVRTFVAARRGRRGTVAAGDGGEDQGSGDGRVRSVFLAHDEERNLHVATFGWARFRKQDIIQIAEYAPFIEMGAGSGWLAFLLRQVGAQIEAFDLQATDSATYVPQWQQWPWSADVKRGSVERLGHRSSGTSIEHDASSSSKSLLLCWPDLGSQFATDCLTFYGGSRLVFIGEQRGGETAEEPFYEALERGWGLLASWPLAQRGHERDFVHVYQRK